MQDVIEEGKFKYIESNSESQETLLLLHGLFGALSNFGSIIDHFGDKLNVVVPILPIYEMPFRQVGLGGLLEYINEFVEHKGYKNVHVLGNSLGGHISLLYVLSQQQNVASMTLAGSSGLFENAFGSTFPKRGNYEFIREKTAATFYDPEMATKELVDEVFDIVNDRNKALRVVVTAKSAIRHNVETQLKDIKIPVLLVWGKDDNVTPAFVGEKFHELLPNSRLFMLDKCGHVPMMEHAEVFNQHLEDFLNEVATEKIS